MKELTKWTPKTCDLSDNNTTEIIIDQSWGALTFPLKSTINKCLNYSVMLSTPYMRFESTYAILNVCVMH